MQNHKIDDRKSENQLKLFNKSWSTAWINNSKRMATLLKIMNMDTEEAAPYIKFIMDMKDNKLSISEIERDKRIKELDRVVFNIQTQHDIVEIAKKEFWSYVEYYKQIEIEKHPELYIHE